MEGEYFYVNKKRENSHQTGHFYLAQMVIFKCRLTGIGISLLDGGMSYEALMGLALNAAGATSSTSVVNLLWTNLFGTAPSASDAQPYVAMLNQKTMSAAQLGVLAADLDLNAQNINLVGLADTGLAYEVA